MCPRCSLPARVAGDGLCDPEACRTRLPSRKDSGLGRRAERLLPHCGSIPPVRKRDDRLPVEWNRRPCSDLLGGSPLPVLFGRCPQARPHADKALPTAQTGPPRSKADSVPILETPGKPRRDLRLPSRSRASAPTAFAFAHRHLRLAGMSHSSPSRRPRLPATRRRVARGPPRRLRPRRPRPTACARRCKRACRSERSDTASDGTA